jgi:chemotaxis protein histidine kinase CheA
MATLKEYFEREAETYLQRLRAMLEDAIAAYSAGELHRVMRALRGTAQMAREEHVYNVALTVERVLRHGTAKVPPPPDLAGRLEATLDDLAALISGSEDGDLAARAAARWSDVAGPAAGDTGVVATGSGPSAAFMAYAAREAGAIADELERGVAALIADPLDREVIKRILRQQRPLLGATMLDHVPIVAETLRAVEELARVIAKLDVPVKGEWLDVFRSARDIMHVSAPALAFREQPSQTTALSRLRTLRDEILDRYGAGEAISIAPGERLQGTTAVVAAPPAEAPAEAGAGAETAADARAPAEAGAPAETGTPAEAGAPAETGTPAGAEPSAEAGPLAEAEAAGARMDMAEAPAVKGTDAAATSMAAEAAAGQPTTAPAAADQGAPAAEPPETVAKAARAAETELPTPSDVARDEEATLPAVTPGASYRPIAPANEAAAWRDAPAAINARRVSEEPPAQKDEIVDIRTLCYRGDAALRRALALRARLEAAVGKQPAARELLDEIFDLIRLGLE